MIFFGTYSYFTTLSDIADHLIKAYLFYMYIYLIVVLLSCL
jgi:hypothetical protein